MVSPPNRNVRTTYRCSFCGKGHDQVQRLIAGPGGVYICDECIDLCQEILEEHAVIHSYLTDRTLRQIHEGYTKKDWSEVIRKVGDLSLRAPESLSPEIYCMQGRAFLEVGDEQSASKSLTLALTTDRSQQLKLLEEYTAILIS